MKHKKKWLHKPGSVIKLKDNTTYEVDRNGNFIRTSLKRPQLKKMSAAIKKVVGE